MTAPTRSTPASPATRPVSTTSSLKARRAAWSTRARPRDRTGPAADSAVRAGSPSSAPDPPGCRPRHRGRARARVELVRSRRRDRRPVRHRPADPRQGRVRRDDPVLPTPPRADRRQAPPRPPRQRRRPDRLRRGHPRHRRRRRGSRPSPASTTRRSCPTSTSSATASPSASRSRSSAPAASASTSANSSPPRLPDPRPAAWKAEWGVTDPEVARGALTKPHPEPSPREVYLLQRKPGKIGAGLGKTTGWVHRAALKNKRVELLRASTTNASTTTAST